MKKFLPVTNRWSILGCLWVLLVMATIITGCNKDIFTLPRLSFEETPQDRLPIHVSYEFDQNLVQATLPTDGCDLPYTIPSGEIITNTFLEESQERFAGATTHPTSGSALPATNPNTLTIRVSLINQSFIPTGRTGEEDRYLAMVNLQLLTVYVDAAGHELAKTPLQYNSKASMWTPSLSSSSTSCATGQFDAAIQKAAKQLVRDMIKVIPQLYGQQPSGTQQVQSGPSGLTIGAAFPALAFRSMLEDANHDLVLDGGEMVVLKLETTNAGTTALQNITINLSGSQDLVKAFTSTMKLPLNIGELQAGESRITEIRGKIPLISEKKQGELVISATMPNGQTSKTHRILASLQPGRGQQENISSPTQQGEPEPTKATAGAGPPYYAILAGLDSYQEPWPRATLPFIGQLQPLTDVLEITGTFSGDHLKTLQGPQATKSALEDTLFSWARERVTQDTILIFYYYGQALVQASSGEVYLLPYDSSPRGSSKSLIPLQALQLALAKLHTKTTLLFLDTPLIQGQEGHSRGSINWEGALPKLLKTGNHSLIQIRHRNPIQMGDSARMLAGLFGRADRNTDHTITLGELLEDVKGIAEITPGSPLLPTQTDIPLTQ